MHKQKFKVAHARIAQKGECCNWNQRLMRGLGSILTGSNIFCFHVASDANISIIASVVYL